MALAAGIYLGLEIAAWMEEEAQRERGPVIDVSPVEGTMYPQRVPGLSVISPTNRDAATPTLNFGES
jgi:hypothetical protein